MHREEVIGGGNCTAFEISVSLRSFNLITINASSTRSLLSWTPVTVKTGGPASKTGFLLISKSKSEVEISFLPESRKFIFWGIYLNLYILTATSRFVSKPSTVSLKSGLFTVTSNSLPLLQDVIQF